MSTGLSLPRMGRALVLVSPSRSFFSTLLSSRVQFHRLYSTLEPPNVGRLAETARISLVPDQVQEFGPKITRVVDWFGQLQAVDLESIEPAIRAETEGDNLRFDLPENFDNREGIITSLPSYEEPYIKVPKILNREQRSTGDHHPTGSKLSEPSGMSGLAIVFQVLS